MKIKSCDKKDFNEDFLNQGVILMERLFFSCKNKLSFNDQLLIMNNIENNKIYFSIMPDGTDPDDFIKQKGKDGLLNLLKEKEIIQSKI